MCRGQVLRPTAYSHRVRSCLHANPQTRLLIHKPARCTAPCMCPLLLQSVQCSPHLHTLHTHVKPRAPAGAEGWRLWRPEGDTCALWAEGSVCLDSGVRGRQMPCSWRSQLWQRLTDHLPSPTLRGLHGLRGEQGGAESQDQGGQPGGSRPVPALSSDVAALQEGLLLLGHSLGPACPGPGASARSCAPAPTSRVWEGPASPAPSSTLPCLGRTLNSIRLWLRDEKEPHPTRFVLGAQRSLLERDFHGVPHLPSSTGTLDPVFTDEGTGSERHTAGGRGGVSPKALATHLGT